MIFSSPLFLSMFLPILLCFYFISPIKLRNYILLFSSLFFYSWGEPKAVFALIFIIVCTYYIGLGISKAQKKEKKDLAKTLLSFGVLLNLVVLIFYKYLSFFITGMNNILGVLQINLIKDPSIALPIGISFYIFQIISYLIDVYRRQVEVQKSFSSLALYISLFPQLLSGPIVRYGSICKDINNRYFNLDNVFIGLNRFVIGLSKKLLIADNMALIADKIFDSPVSQIPCAFAWLGAIAFTLQIFFDFSGYSDMAIGLGRIFNFKFPENFNFPYSAVSIQDFWRRWHISLSSWFKDYLYIPLGGNRISKFRTYLNLFFVFGLCGLWHGASWSFVVWGLYHGAGLVWERIGLINYIYKLPKLIANLYVVLFVVIGWVFFRASNLTHAVNYLRIMLMGNESYSLNTFYQALDFLSYSNALFLFLAVTLSYPFIPSIFEKIRYQKSGIFCAIILFLIAYVFSMTSNINTFIYFRF